MLLKGSCCPGHVCGSAKASRRDVGSPSRPRSPRLGSGSQGRELPISETSLTKVLPRNQNCTK